MSETIERPAYCSNFDKIRKVENWENKINKTYYFGGHEELVKKKKHCGHPANHLWNGLQCSQKENAVSEVGLLGLVSRDETKLYRLHSTIVYRAVRLNICFSNISPYLDYRNAVH